MREMRTPALWRANPGAVNGQRRISLRNRVRLPNFLVNSNEMMIPIMLYRSSPMKKITPQDALVYIMITTSAADTTMTDAELSSIGNVVSRLPVFQGFDKERLPKLASDCYALLADEDGLEKILDLAHDALPERLYDTAYALAVEVAAADLHVEQEELEFLQMLRDRWTLDELTVAAIERSARVRFRKLDPAV